MRVDVVSEHGLEQLKARWPLPGGVHDLHHCQTAAGRATHLAVWEGDIPRGSCLVQWGGCLGPGARRAFPRTVEINHLQVRDGARGRGAGSAVLEAAEDLVRRRGIGSVAVGVDESNDRARGLYIRRGFAPTGVVDVVEYEWIDEGGAPQRARERIELLVKEL